VTSRGNVVDAPKLSHCAWRGTAWSPVTDVWVLSHAHFQSHCIPGLMERFHIHSPAHSRPFWDTCIVDERERERDSEHWGKLAACSTDSNWHSAFVETFVPLKPAFSPLLPHHTLLQVFVMSLKEICLAKHNVFISEHCSLADIFKCNEPRICRKKQTADNVNSA
jgi:hypothetical protein